jgi:phytoene dehydrogenase-like protein
MGVASPFFRELPLAQHGLEWVHTPTLLAHPFDDGSAITLERTLDATVEAARPRRRGVPLADGAVRRPLGRPGARRAAPIRIPRTPSSWRASDCTRCARWTVSHAAASATTRRARCSPPSPATACCRSTGAAPRRSASCSASPATPSAGRWPAAAPAPSPARWPRTCANSAASSRRTRPSRHARAAARPRHAVRRHAAAVPAHCRRPAARRATAAARALPLRARRVQGRLGAVRARAVDEPPLPRRPCCTSPATYDEVLASERAPWEGDDDAAPFVLFVQPSLFDPTRAPAGRPRRLGILPRAARLHRRHAPPSSRRRSSASRPASATPSSSARHDARRPRNHNNNMVGGDINAGAQHLRQLFFRPVPRWNPYTTPVAGSTSAPHPRRPAAPSTACAATTPRRPR